MFRLAEYEPYNPELFKYLAPIASKTIYNALYGLFGSIYDVEELYLNTFAGAPVGARKTDFFHGLADFISERSTVRTTVLGEIISEDGRAGMELMDRKIKRMKAKMLDPDQYYTFDLFEELLFHIVIETYRMIGEEPTEELLQKIKATESELKSKSDLDPDEIANMAENVCRIEKMGLEDGELFFWDDDFAILFHDGFISGIRMLVSGAGGNMGYGYKDVCSIFTDAGIRAPLLLVGTETAFQARGDVVIKKMAEALKSIPTLKPSEEFNKGLEEQGFDEDDLPFN